MKPERKTQLPKKTKQQEVSADRVKDPRGRKEKKVQQYEAESLRKFKEWQRQIDQGTDERGKKISAKEIAAIKNKMATQKARLEKKLETEQLERENETMKDRVQKLIKALDTAVPNSNKAQLVERLQDCLDIESGK